MNRKQLIVTSVLVLSMFILVISQSFFNENFERINTVEKQVSEFKEYKLNVDNYCILLPNEWSVKGGKSEGYISYELNFKGTNDDITGIIEVINTKEDVKVFADKDVKSQSLKYTDLIATPFENDGISGVLNEYTTSIRGGNTYKNKSYYLALNNNQIIKVLFNIKNTASDESAEVVLKEIISSIKDTN